MQRAPKLGLFALTLMAAIAAGCASSATHDGSDSAESSDELRRLSYHDCRGASDRGTGITRFELRQTTTTARITDLGPDAAAPGWGTIDRKYAPTSKTYQGATRFQGYERMFDSAHSDIGTIELIVSPTIRDSDDSGYVWIRSSGAGGGSSERFSCTKKDAPIKVDTNRYARIVCDLKPIVCGPGAPPGETCLSDLYVRQYADDRANMRVTILDHFGVNISERKEWTGASTELERTTRAFRAELPGYTLDLTYRAGVTYEGTLAIDGGESTNVKCSDLAMLDD